MMVQSVENVPARFKRREGVYFTAINPFSLRPFKAWAKKVGLKSNRVLEPFAGGNNIIKMLKEEKLCNRFCSYDVYPRESGVKKKNTMEVFPRGYKNCVSNPPWLASYSARRRGIHFPDIGFDNLYQHCLKLALENCDNVAFILPGTYIRTGLFFDRLDTAIFINSRLFNDTENPACIALFTNNCKKDTRIYHDNMLVGTLSDLKKIDARYRQTDRHDRQITFNSPRGKLGLVCIDSTAGQTIRFCKGSEINRPVKHSDRLITKIDGDFGNITRTIKNLNRALGMYRRETHDVFLAPFKGLRKDGEYRRRLDYELARGLIVNYG